jgi:hypothetical protein
MRNLIATTLAAIGFAATAAETTQTFESTWTVEPWNYYGYIAAMQWHYLPYDPWNPALGSLQKVTVITDITGSRSNYEELNYGYSFFTGWSPDDFQFGRGAVLSSGTGKFSFTESYTFTSAGELSRWANYLYFPPANYYFESRTITGGHSISALTTITFSYVQSVPEASTTTAFLLGLLTIVTLRRNGSA